MVPYFALLTPMLLLQGSDAISQIEQMKMELMVSDLVKAIPDSLEKNKDELLVKSGPYFLTISYRTKTYFEYSETKGGPNTNLPKREVLGPASDGFIFQLSLQKKSESNQLVLPQSCKTVYGFSFIYKISSDSQPFQVLASYAYACQDCQRTTLSTVEPMPKDHSHRLKIINDIIKHKINTLPN